MLFHTENETTTTVGQATATVILQSVNTFGNVLTTVELVYPRYIHSELMTHRMFSRSACSSRATPLRVMADEVIRDPVFFDSIGVNQPGMVAGEELGDEEKRAFREDWRLLGGFIANWALAQQQVRGIHKQVLNRVLEPFSRIRVLVTATEWENFFNLRLAPDAQPEMQSLARAIHQAMDKTTPALREEHFPYIRKEEQGMKQWDKAMVSAARCARVSYARHDEKKTSVESDIALAERLFNDKHMSPFEHAAVAKPGEFYANFNGWQSVRRIMGE